MTTKASNLMSAMPAVAIYWTAVGALLYASLLRADGHLVYPLDDTYVHMAMAKNMALHGVWGVTAEQFTSASSSPLWTGLLALIYGVFGVSDWPPFVLNVLIGTALVVSIHQLLRSAGMVPLAALLSTVAITLLGTVPTLTLLGMEHTLHALVTIWFVTRGLRLLTKPEPAGGWRLVALLAAVITPTRYEGAFTVACVAGAMAVARHWRAAAAVSLAGALPIVVYGLWSQANGGFLLPNSVLLKGVAPELTAIGMLQSLVFWPAFVALMANSHLAFLLVAALGLAVAARRHPQAPHHVWLALVFAGATLLHMQFARAGWFYRYEAYLVVLGLLTVAVIGADVEWAAVSPGRGITVPAVALVLLAGVVMFPLVRRGANAARQTPVAVSNIFEQQYQVGRFLDQFYRGHRVAVNDVGAVGYLADVHLLDVWGLASPDTASLKRRGAFTTAALEQLAAKDQTEIAIIYPSWLGEYGGVPANWQKVGEWRVTNNVVLGENGMSFYAVTAGARERLIDSLAKYSERLPSAVVQEGLYLAHR